MDNPLMITILWAAMGAVVITMIFGFVTMLRGNQSLKSNRLMQIRVGLQLLALVLFAFLLWSKHG